MVNLSKFPLDGLQNFSINVIGLCPLSSTNIQGKLSVPCLFKSFRCLLADSIFFLLSRILPFTTCSAYQVVNSLLDDSSIIAPIFTRSFLQAIKSKFCLAFLMFSEIVKVVIYITRHFFRQKVEQTVV